MGWPEATLKSAMAQCNEQSGQLSACSVLTARSEQDMNDCAIPNRVAEPLDQCKSHYIIKLMSRLLICSNPIGLTVLPGCNPVQVGPGRATPSTGCGAPTDKLPASSVSFLKSGITGWTPVGCASENAGETLLNGAKYTPGGLTVEKCLNYCNTQGFTYAGLKNRNTCSCGKTLNTSKISASYACNLACEGDLNGMSPSRWSGFVSDVLCFSSEYCGAATRIAVYSGNGPVDIPTTSQVPTISQPPSQSTPGPVTSQPPVGGTVAKYGQVSLVSHP